MIAMNEHDQHLRGIPAQPTCQRAGLSRPRPVRRAMLRVLSMVGLGIGGVAAMDDDEVLGMG